MQYFIQYVARNHYDRPVAEALFDFLVAPATSEHQRVLRRELNVEPAGSMHTYTGLFGFDTLRIRPRTPFAECSFRFSFWVRKYEAYPEGNEWQPADILAAIRAHVFQVDHALFLSQTDATRLDADIGPAPYGGMQLLSEYLLEINRFVYESLRFEPGVTHVHTTAEETWRLRSGVCQDYTHLMLGLIRRQGIPARYVSGYLNPGPGHQGASAMHAWVEAFVPGLGWIGLDPTNNLLVDTHFIKVSHGCDYHDCPPIKGVLLSEGGQRTTYEVQILREQ
ncbi:MAG: transglutaminase family protein [Bacteroidia bacterium]|nr:transglutaminase family protein [Bacteroidia bacterium]